MNGIAITAMGLRVLPSSMARLVDQMDDENQSDGDQWAAMIVSKGKVVERELQETKKKIHEMFEYAERFDDLNRI